MAESLTDIKQKKKKRILGHKNNMEICSNILTLKEIRCGQIFLCFVFVLDLLKGNYKPPLHVLKFQEIESANYNPSWTMLSMGFETVDASRSRTRSSITDRSSISSANSDNVVLNYETCL